MTKDEQKRIIKELSVTIEGALAWEIEEGKVPNTWDGHELRELFADRTATFRSRHLTRQRKKNYLKICQNLNL